MPSIFWLKWDMDFSSKFTTSLLVSWRMGWRTLVIIFEASWKLVCLNPLRFSLCLIVYLTKIRPRLSYISAFINTKGENARFLASMRTKCGTQISANVRLNSQLNVHLTVLLNVNLYGHLNVRLNVYQNNHKNLHVNFI